MKRLLLTTALGLVLCSCEANPGKQVGKTLKEREEILEAQQIDKGFHCDFAPNARENVGRVYHIYETENGRVTDSFQNWNSKYTIDENFRVDTGRVAGTYTGSLTAGGLLNMLSVVPANLGVNVDRSMATTVVLEATNEKADAMENTSEILTRAVAEGMPLKEWLLSVDDKEPGTYAVVTEFRKADAIELKISRDISRAFGGDANFEKVVKASAQFELKGTSETDFSMGSESWGEPLAYCRKLKVLVETESGEVNESGVPSMTTELGDDLPGGTFTFVPETE